MLMLFILHLRC